MILSGKYLNSKKNIDFTQHSCILERDLVSSTYIRLLPRYRLDIKLEYPLCYCYHLPRSLNLPPLQIPFRHFRGLCSILFNEIMIILFSKNNH